MTLILCHPERMKGGKSAFPQEARATLNGRKKRRYCTVPLVELVVWTEPTKQSSCFVELIQCLAPHGDVKLLFIVALGLMMSWKKWESAFFDWWSWGENVTTKRHYLPLKYLRCALQRTSWPCQGWCGYTAIHICPMPPVGQTQPLEPKCESERSDNRPTVWARCKHTHRWPPRLLRFLPLLDPAWIEDDPVRRQSEWPGWYLSTMQCRYFNIKGGTFIQRHEEPQISDQSGHVWIVSTQSRFAVLPLPSFLGLARHGLSGLGLAGSWPWGRRLSCRISCRGLSSLTNTTECRQMTCRQADQKDGRVRISARNSKDGLMQIVRVPDRAITYSRIKTWSKSRLGEIRLYWEG